MTPTIPVGQSKLNRREALARDLFQRPVGSAQEHEFAPQPAVLQQPWVAMPPDGEPFDLVQSIVTPNADGVDNVVISFRVAAGWEAVVKGVGHLYQGTGYVEGVSGQIIWRIRVNSTRFLRGYQAVQVSLGSLAAQRPVEGGHRLYSNDLIEYLVAIPVGSPLATGGNNTCIAMLTGWVYPVRTSGRV